MIRLFRLPIGPQTQKWLAEKTLEVAQTNKTKKDLARSLFQNKSNLAFNEVRTVLKWMNGGSEVCMYCQSNEGSAIDHFEPLSENPERGFDWKNYLWACERCNSNQKRDQYPLHLGTPLLIDPSDEEPRDFLSLTNTGKFSLITEEDGETDDAILRRLKNNTTIEIFKLNQRQVLVNSRKDAWIALLKCFLPEYASAVRTKNIERARDLSDSCKQPPLVNVLAYLWKIMETSTHAELLLGQETLEIMRNHPEIGTWFVPETRARRELHELLFSSLGTRVKGVKKSELMLADRLIQLERFSCKDGEVTVSLESVQKKKLRKIELNQGEVTLVFHGARLSMPFQSMNLKQ